MEYRRDIDGLRAVAVGTVVLAHAGVPGFSGGFIGVDVFFVISGYLICSILLKDLEEGRFSLVDFYERRARRILPALFTVIAACFAVGWFLFPPPQYEALGESALASVFFVSNIFFMVNTSGYFSGSAEYQPLLHTWSLSVEEQFYLLIPLLMWALFIWARRWLVQAFVLGCMVSFALAVWAVTHMPEYGFFLTPMRAWELGAGALLAMGLRRRTAPPLVLDVVAVAGLAAILLPAVLYEAATPFPGLAAVPPVIGTVALIWSGQHRKTLVAQGLASTPMVGLGLISYSLYLWHWPALVVARGFSGGGHIEPAPAVLAILASLALSVLTWRYVEQPIRRRGVFPSGKSVARFSLASAAGLSLVGVGTIASQGVWQRSPELKASYYKAITTSDVEKSCYVPEAGDEHPCRIGHEREQNTPTVLVWGDSHAGAMMPGFDAWFRSRNLTADVALRPGCVPILGLSRKGANCPERNQQVIDQLRESTEIETVFLVGRWPLWATGLRSEGEHGIDLIQLDAKGEALNHALYAQRLEERLQATLTKLRSMGKEVVVISAVAEIGHDVPLGLLGARYYGAKPPQAPSLDDVIKRQGSSLNALRRATAASGAELLELSSVACGETCPIAAGDVWFYRDDDHLSSDGAEFVVGRALDAWGVQ